MPTYEHWKKFLMMEETADILSFNVLPHEREEWREGRTICLVTQCISQQSMVKSGWTLKGQGSRASELTWGWMAHKLPQEGWPGPSLTLGKLREGFGNYTSFYLKPGITECELSVTGVFGRGGKGQERV